ncbi:MAG: hypothetical protein U0414_16050 [Polyangiaceae bacterium]
MNSLALRFREAGLPLELRVVPLSVNAGAREHDIVQIDIAEGPLRNRARRATSVTNLQRFRVFPGHSANALDVLDADASLHQVVLRVDEPMRLFEVRVRRSEAPLDADVLREERGSLVIARRTSGTVRHFLCGMDESHLFIAQLPSLASSVGAAHAALRPEVLDRLEKTGPSIRQGEWFFVPLSDEEHARVDTLAKRAYRVHHKKGIAEAARLSRLGRQHVANEVVVVPDVASGEERIFVRGAVVHPDHKTVVLRAWHRTIPNTEHLEVPVPGVDWYD